MGEKSRMPKVNSIFTYFGENRTEEILNLCDKDIPAKMLFINSGIESQFTKEGIMLSDVKIVIGNYDFETGIVRVNFEPSVPLWVFNNFAGYFIPKFDE